MFAAVLLLLVQIPAPAPAAPCAGCVAGTAQSAAPTEAGAVTGTVRDIGGGIVSGASIVVRVSGSEQQTVTGPDGRFTASAPAAAEVSIVVRAAGFAETRQTIAPGARRLNVDIVVAPATVTEAVTVTPTRSERRTGDVPASVSVMSRRTSGSRRQWWPTTCCGQLPTFSLFRRSSSLVVRIRPHRACRFAASDRAA